MKKQSISLLLVLALLWALCACGQTQQEVPTTTTQEPTQTTTVATETEPQWQPFEGESKDYVYYHEKGKAHKWEEDVIYFAETCLNHPLLTPEESRVTFRVGKAMDGYYTDRFYNEELRESFLAEINALIQKLDTMEEEAILYELQHSLAQLRDLHSAFYLPESKLFPFYLEPLAKEEGTGAYVVLVDEAYEELLLTELVSVNGIAVEEILQTMRPYVSYENEPAFMQDACSMLIQESVLMHLGIMEESADEAAFVFRATDGTEYTHELSAISITRFQRMDYAEVLYTTMAYYWNATKPEYWDDYGKDYWYFIDDDMAYFRIDSFASDSGKTLREIGNQVLAEVAAVGGVKKFVLDLRENSGGYRIAGYDEIITILQRLQIDTVYVLINSASYSRSIILATSIRQDIENTVIVGSAGGQAVNFFADIEYYTLPNSEHTFQLSKAWIEMDAEDKNDALMPDVIIEQTAEDYENGVDAVMEYIKAQ